MAEDPKTLQILLIEKTGMPPEDIRKELLELRNKIEAIVEAGDHFTIEELGTFSGEDRALSFEPSVRLQTEINQMYAGMQPIELVEAFKKTGAGVPLGPVEQEIVQEPEPSSEITVESAEPGTDREIVDEPEEAQPVAEALNKTDSKEGLRTSQSAPKKHYSPNRRKKDNGTWIAAAAVFIIVILVIGWLFFTHRLGSGNGSSNIATRPVVNSAKTGDLAAKREENLTHAQNSKPFTGGDSTQLNETAAGLPSATYGLRGKVNVQLEEAYTIVVHSFQLKSTVQNIAENLSRKGYRAVVFSAGSDGETNWRVGLGQFKTIEAAQKAVKELPEQYQKSHFIHRINF